MKSYLLAGAAAVTAISLASHAGAQGVQKPAGSAETGLPEPQSTPAASADQAGTPPAADAAGEPAPQDVVVTGFRASIAKSIDLKRRSDVMLDAISADDIASFPEANVAESLQRIPGVSIDRDNGEGRQISVRGLDGNFTRIRINGMEALSTSAQLISALSTPNQSRSFDFNTFASELFSQASVRKTTSAETDEGSLGATVDLNTPHPLDYKGQRIAFNAADAYYTNGKKHAPRLSGLYSNKFFNDVVGMLVSGAFQKRTTIVSNYKRGPVGQGDLLYRGMTWAGNENQPRAGFAAPTGTTFNQSVLTPTNATTRCPGITAGGFLPQGVTTVCSRTAAGSPTVSTPGFFSSPSVTAAINNPLVLAAQTGSDPAAYAALFPSSNSNAPNRYDDSTVIIPSLPGLAQQKLRTKRIGLTGSLQFKISSRTKLTVDGLYSKFDQTSDQYGIEPVGLGRNNTNAALNTLATGASAATLRGLYPTPCAFSAGSATQAAQDCGQQLYGTTPVPGYTFSLNPNNRDAYEYYNNPLSPGYAPNTYGINGLIPLLGRPTTKVLGAQVTNGVADYLALQNVDWRSQALRVTANTEFKQASAVLDQQIGDTLSAKLSGGWSNSKLYYDSLQVEFNSLDRQETYVYDARQGGDMPIFNPGFNVADPSNWGIVKGLSVMRDNRFTTDTTFYTGRGDFKWDVNDEFSLLFGGSYKQFDYVTTGQARFQDSFNATEKEAGVSTASLGQTLGFGTGLKLAEGTPTSLFVPNMDAFISTFGNNCNCVNKFGDYRLTGLRSNVVGSNYSVKEKDTGGYVQANFKKDLFGQPFSGNAGLRIVQTDVGAVGRTLSGQVITDSNTYTDYLPSLNLNYEVLPNVQVRFGASRAMSRPTLANLSPSITSISIPTDVGALVGGTLAVGNTRVSPYRSSNLDLGVEWYFRPNSVIALAVFDKQISSFPQLVTFDSSLSAFLSADAIAALRANYPSGTDLPSAQQLYIDRDLPFAVRQFRDAPGGYLRGIEFNFQTDFWFLPSFLKNFGIQLNATKIKSSLQYVLDPGVRAGGMQTVQPVYGRGPFLNASPEAVNFTFYYQDKKFSARSSLSWRSDYYTQYPIQSGACTPGSAAGVAVTVQPCATPLMNDFIGARGGMNVDAVVTYELTSWATLRLEGLNLTNRTDNRFAYTANPQITNYASSGTQITAGARFKF